MLSRRLLSKKPFVRLTWVATQTRRSSQTALDPDVIGTPELRLSAPKPKKPVREPFGKNLFLGKFDVEFLAYPEPQTHDRHREFFAWLKPIEDYVNTSIDYRQTDVSASIPDEVFEELRRLGVLRAAVDDAYGGLGLNNSEYAKLVETVSAVPALGTFLIKRASVVNLITKFGSDEQKREILPKIASGELRPALCFSESPSGSFAEPPSCKAVYSDCRTFFTVEGRKTWVADAANANVFVVLALNATTDDWIEATALGAYLVPADADGVVVGERLPTLGQRGLTMCDVTFRNVRIPANNRLSRAAADAEIFINAMGEGKHYTGGQAIGLSKRFLNLLTTHVRRGKNFNSKRHQDELLHDSIGRIARSLYSMEAVTYLTTGMMDSFESQDCIVEQSLTEIHCSNECVEGVIQGLRILGAVGYSTNEPFELMARDALALNVYDRSGADSKIFAALLGVQHAGKHLGESVKKSRNSLYNPLAIARNVLSISSDEKLFLDENLHPSLRVSAISLEESVHNLRKAVEAMLTYSGISLMSRRMELKRLAEVAIEVYAMTAAVARASRSYCIGLRNAEHEVEMAMIFTYQTYEKVNMLVRELKDGDWTNGDVYAKNIADSIFAKKSYFAEHPLERTY